MWDFVFLFFTFFMVESGGIVKEDMDWFMFMFKYDVF